jgi:hypothetical protein
MNFTLHLNTRKKFVIYMQQQSKAIAASSMRALLDSFGPN